MPAPARVHATCIAIGVARDARAGRSAPLTWAGALLLGPSGSGKSDLALRLIDAGDVLVADDQVALDVRAGRLFASAPPHLPALLEVRGVGLVPMERAKPVALAAVFDLTPGGHGERLPPRALWRFGGVALPLYCIDPAGPSAAARVRLLVARAPVDADVDVDVDVDVGHPVDASRDES